MIETPASQNSFSTSAASKPPRRVEHVAASIRECPPSKLGETRLVAEVDRKRLAWQTCLEIDRDRDAATG
jgi:hypothetical protein